MMTILILGATSALAQETARCFATTGASFILVARDKAKLQSVQNDLNSRGAKEVKEYICDLSNCREHAALFKWIQEQSVAINYCLIAYGVLTDQEKAEQSFEYFEQQHMTNFTSAVSLCMLTEQYFLKQNSGCLAVLSSVAGDRGRRKNYAYGSSKAALQSFLSGMRAKNAKTNIRIITINPGLCDTPMTAHIKKGLLCASAQSVGSDIHRYITSLPRAWSSDIFYTPFYWRYIMLMIAHIPECIFKRMRF